MKKLRKAKGIRKLRAKEKSNKKRIFFAPFINKMNPAPKIPSKNKAPQSGNQKIVSHLIDYLLPIPASFLIPLIHQFPDLLNNVVRRDDISKPGILMQTLKAPRYLGSLIWIERSASQDKQRHQKYTLGTRVLGEMAEILKPFLDRALNLRVWRGGHDSSVEVNPSRLPIKLRGNEAVWLRYLSRHPFTNLRVNRNCLR